MLNLKIPEKELKSLSRSFNNVEKTTAKISTKVLNKAARLTKNEEVKLIKKQYYIEPKILKEYISVEKATSKRPLSMVKVKNRPFKLDYFKVTPPMVGRQTIQGYVERGRGALKINDLFWGFHVNRPSIAQIFRREGKDRLPVKNIWVSSMNSMALNPIVENKLLEFAENKLQDLFYEELDKELKKNE